MERSIKSEVGKLNAVSRDAMPESIGDRVDSARLEPSAIF
jgi:hypothetical protein